MTVTGMRLSGKMNSPTIMSSGDRATSHRAPRTLSRAGVRRFDRAKVGAIWALDPMVRASEVTRLACLGAARGDAQERAGTRDVCVAAAVCMRAGVCTTVAIFGRGETPHLVRGGRRSDYVGEIKC
jgi:hypothetical protein